MVIGRRHPGRIPVHGTRNVDRAAIGHAAGRLRRAAASVEVVIATGMSFSASAVLAYHGMRACRNLFHVVSNLIGLPHM